MEKYIEKIEEAVKYIKGKTDYRPEIGMVLGSGLGSIAEDIQDAVVIPYSEIPNFPISSVVGHAGNLVIGRLQGRIVFALQGRVHFYEGHSMKYITFPIRVMLMLGIKKLLVTNACGGVNETFTPGTLMLISDHINFMGASPLTGENYDVFGPRFPDVSYCYSKKYRDIAMLAKNEIKTPLREGVYCAFMGPAYETPAEVKFAKIIGADAVGMSTVPEVLVAKHGGMEVLGISCITNMAAGILDQPLDHKEVVEIAAMVHNDFVKLIKIILPQM